MTADDEARAAQPNARKVLVSAASLHGSTEGIAHAIGDVLAGAGLRVSLIPPQQVGDVGEYDAVILGSAVYSGHWLAAAKDLVDRSGPALAGRPVWLFSSGPVGDPAGRLARAMAADPAEIAGIRAATHAQGHMMFAGRLEPGDLGLAQRAALTVVRGLRGDFRDWAAIRQWAQEIAGQLTAHALR